MLEQSKRALDELRTALENYQKQQGAAMNDLRRAQELASHIEEHLSKPVIVRMAPQQEVQVVLERAARVKALDAQAKPYQAQKSIVELQRGLRVLLENLPGDPDEDPDFPWDKSV